MTMLLSPMIRAENKASKLITESQKIIPHAVLEVAPAQGNANDLSPDSIAGAASDALSGIWTAQSKALIGEGKEQGMTQLSRIMSYTSNTELKEVKVNA